MQSPIQEFEARELRVLLIEDSEPDAELTIRRLRAAGLRCSYRCAVNEQEMRSALSAELPDLILSDFSLPGFDGMTALAVARGGRIDLGTLPVKSASGLRTYARREFRVGRRWPLGSRSIILLNNGGLRGVFT